MSKKLIISHNLLIKEDCKNLINLLESRTYKQSDEFKHAFILAYSELSESLNGLDNDTKLNILISGVSLVCKISMLKDTRTIELLRNEQQ